MKREEIRRVVRAARAFLIHRLAEVLDKPPWKDAQQLDPEEILEDHLNPKIEPPTSLDQIMARLLVSAQNRQSAPNVILGSVDGGLDGMRVLLGGFDPAKISARWKTGKQILDHLVASGGIRGKMRRSKRSLWPQYCETISSGSVFLARFESAKKFRNWVSKFRGDPDREAALPLILAEEIKGFGLALASDFLKELGYDEFGKPDVHTKRLLEKTRISDATTDYMILRDTIRAARSIEMSPYAFDKVFWLIGSGRFYLVQEKVSGKALFIRRQGKAFLKHWVRSRGRPRGRAGPSGSRPSIKPPQEPKSPRATAN